MTEQQTHMSQIPAGAGIAARAAWRPRTAPLAAGVAFCSSVFTPTDAGGTLISHRRPPIE